MRSRQSFIVLVAAFMIAFASLAVTTPLFATGPERVLYSFCSASNCADGQQSWAALIFDSVGNLYGTTAAGGSSPQCYTLGNTGCGTVFKLSRGADGQWAETVLYSFCSRANCADGANPYDALIFDSAGNLYGTTAFGGKSGCCGTIFELSPGANGQWTETVLYNFCSAANCADGAYPYAGLIFDSAGNLYGTTADVVLNRASGCYPTGFCGKVFQLKAGADGHWTYRVLHKFRGKDGSVPELGNLIFDTAGNLYGTTNFGGRISKCSNGCGTVFELTPGANDQWTEKVLYNFVNDGRDGYNPLFGLVFDTSGNLYSTTFGGGRFSGGTVFQLSPGANGQWTEKVLHAFGSSDGSGPGSGLILDSAGNLYGNTNQGGANGRGTVFRLSPGAGGLWKETLYSFQTGNDGEEPTGNLIFDSDGNLYGTTFGGGISGSTCNGCGTIYEITP